MIFPKDFPEKLRSQILVSEIVGKRVKLKLRGKEFSGLCPFHNEKSPSFTVNDQKGFYHCFGCQAHGDIISFVMQSDGLDYPDAVRQLADERGIEIPQVKHSSVEQIIQETQLDRDYLILEKACGFFEKSLQESFGREAKSYIAKRGLGAGVIKKFRLGYAPNSYEALHKFLQGLGFLEPELQRCGIIGLNNQQKLYDKFRNRVIFPITDKKNRVIAFGGRVLAAEDMPKYLNSAETEVFKKNQTLYNFFHARKSIFDKKYAIVVEGYMDAISLAAAGIENVVAGLGTALGENHLRELFNITDQIIICLDGDSAGLRAAKRVSEIALPIITAKKNISFTFLPNQMDPDDFIKTFGAAELEKNFAKATTLSKALLEFTIFDLGLDKKTKISAEDKAKIEAELTKKTLEIKDATSRKYFSLFFKDALFTIGRNAIKTKQGNAANHVEKNHNFGNLVSKIYAKPNNVADNLAKNIVALIIKYPQLANHHDENFDIKEVNFLNDELTTIKDAAIEFIDNSSEINSEKLLETLDSIGSEAVFREIKNLLATMSSFAVELSEAEIGQKMSLLLLKELLLQVDWQYKQSLAKIDEIETYQTTIINEKIKELFAYKNLLEQKILALTKDLI